MTGKLIVISGPSGVGKSTVVKQVMDRCPSLEFSVSATTRPIRPGEIHGKNYYFVDETIFMQMIQNNELLEYAKYVGNYYGTPEAPLEAALHSGKDILLDIEPQGALHVKKRRPDAVLIFMMAPSFDELKHRLKSRGDTPNDVIKDRLLRAKWEYQQARFYDYLVVNKTIDDAVYEILSIISAEKCTVHSRRQLLEEEL